MGDGTWEMSSGQHPCTCYGRLLQCPPEAPAPSTKHYVDPSRAPYLGMLMHSCTGGPCHVAGTRWREPASQRGATPPCSLVRACCHNAHAGRPARRAFFPFFPTLAPELAPSVPTQPPPSGRPCALNCVAYRIGKSRAPSGDTHWLDLSCKASR